MHRQRRDVLAGKKTTPASGRWRAGNLVDQRRLAGPVRADQRMHLAGLDHERPRSRP